MTDATTDARNFVFAGFVAYFVIELVATRSRNSTRDIGSTADSGSLVVIVAVLSGTFALAGLARSFAGWLEPPGSALAWALAGAVVCAAGAALRASAVARLGQAYNTVVTIQPGQRLITDGPYRFVRHPAYSGLIVMLAGVGISVANTGALAACLVLPLPALLYRIRVEERALSQAMGDYLGYARDRKRLIPGVW